MIISATILAAGGSSRMGDENKLLLPFNGDLVINQI
jgi:CTP:molybdopterin cytidylyltransferase MocA